jgi:hypothetical protein
MGGVQDFELKNPGPMIPGPMIPDSKKVGVQDFEPLPFFEPLLVFYSLAFRSLLLAPCSLL